MHLKSLLACSRSISWFIKRCRENRLVCGSGHCYRGVTYRLGKNEVTIIHAQHTSLSSSSSSSLYVVGKCNSFEINRASPPFTTGWHLIIVNDDWITTDRLTICRTFCFMSHKDLLHVVMAVGSVMIENRQDIILEGLDDGPAGRGHPTGHVNNLKVATTRPQGNKTWLN